MKKSELRKLVSEYKMLKARLEKSKNAKIQEKMADLRYRYFHETGNDIDQPL